MSATTVPTSMRRGIGGALSSWHPGWKVAVYVNVTAVAVWGPAFSRLGSLALFLSIVVIRGGGPGGRRAVLWMLIASALLVAITIPGGTSTEILIAADISARILAVLVIAVAFSELIRIDDVVRVCRCFGAGEGLTLVAATPLRLLPALTRGMSRVALAQRARGLEMSLRDLARIDTYRSIAVPYVLLVVRVMFHAWIMFHLRGSGSRPSVARRSFLVWLSAIVVGAASASLWFVP